MGKYVSILAALALILILVISGCGSAATTTTTSQPGGTTSTPAPGTSTAAGPKMGGTLTLISQGGFVNFGNPGRLNSPADLRYSSPAIENLLDADSSGNYVPKLATAWTVDATSITFTLRQGVKFHDGTDFNADAVKFCFDLSIAGEWSELKGLTSVEVVDPYTVKLNMEQFDWPILGAVATSPAAWIISPTAYKAHEGTDWALTNPVGTGPFKLASVERDVSIKYTRNDNYWQAGKPYLDGVNFNLMADATTALMSLKAHEGQEMAVQPKDVQDLKNAGFTIVTNPGGCIEIDPSSADVNSPLHDVRVRQAIQYAINTQAISDAIGYGLWQPANQPFAPWAGWAYNPNVVGYPYNPAKAKQLLADAGYPNGFTTQLVSISGSPQDTYLAIQADLAAVGITMQIEPVTMAKFSQMSANGWDGLLFVLTNWSIGVDPGQALKRSFVTLGAKLRVSVQREPDVEQLLIESNKETDLAKRKAEFADMIKKIIDEHCMTIFIYASQAAAAVDPSVHDLGLGQTFWWTLEKTWIE